MFRSVMGMGGSSVPGTRTQAGQQQSRDQQEESAPDSIVLRIELPTARAEQLRALARDLDESPQTLARLWVMERLRELTAGRAPGNKSNGGSQTATPPLPSVIAGLPGPTVTPPPTQASVATVADLKKQLGDTLITAPEEREVYDETYSFRQWGPYVAGLVLTSRGRRMFTLEDMRMLLRDELMPTLYDTPGALDSDLVIRDAEVGRPGDQLRPFACLQRVSPGVYSFLGFSRARAMRSAR
ncbi:MAG: hypothetical protein JXA58_01385 [Dehalococcoidia bacterium]|nr:hypothetical protein [Dehalococcoidia bacterium]